MNDLTGKSFGRLTVIERAKEGTRIAKWLCVCSCGNTCIVRQDCLTRGVTKSCGCLNRE